MVKKPYQSRPEKILYFSIGAILFLVFSSGVLFYIWEINALNYLPDLPLCPFHALTGKPCPGCGMAHAFLLLGQLKFSQALEKNLFSIPLLLTMILYFSFGRTPLWLQNKYFVRISLLAVLSFWIIRLF